MMTLSKLPVMTRLAYARIAAAILLAAIVATLATGCKKTAPEAVATGEDGKASVSLQLNWVPEPEFGGFYAAVNQGIYARSGLDVTLVAGGAGVQTWKMVATGKVPFAIASADEILRARQSGADVVALYAVYQTNPQGLMVHADSGVSSLEDIFSGGAIQRVAMEAGLPYGRFLQKKYGFDKVQVIQHGQNLSLFLQDKTMAQQCFISSEPVSAGEQGAAVRVFSIGESGFNPYTAVLITSEAFLQKNRPLVETLVRASRAGWTAYLAEPGPTNQYMLTQKASMTMAAMSQAAVLQAPYIANDATRAGYLGIMSEQRWSELAAQLVDMGELAAGQDKALDISRVFVNIGP